MIITAKKKISFLWIILACLPWVAVIFKDKVMGPAFVFSMRKFVENPAQLTFMLLLPGYLSWVVPPVVNFLADHIWTPWGRRKPFVVASWIGTISCITLMPLAPDFGWLLAAYMIFVVFNNVGGPVESLKMEIVPPAQRATSQAVLSWIGQVAVLVFWVVAIGRFHEVSTMFGVTVSGEQGMFWAVSVGMVVMLLFVMLGIKETNPYSKLQGQRFSFKSVFGGLFSKHLWPVYILALSVSVLGTGLGAFNALLTTEQWGYTNQEMGTNIMVGGIINLALIPVLGLLSNKVGRGTVYVALVIVGIVLSFGQYMYYNFVLYDGRPTLIEMIVFGEMLSVTGILTGMALTPFQYDFIPRNELGTYAAGSGLVGQFTGMITGTLMGLFVWGYAATFLGPPGEMAQVTLRDDTPTAQVEAALQGGKWTDPANGTLMANPQLHARAWYATGAKLDHGRGFEVRLRDEEGEKIRDSKESLETERKAYKVRRVYAENQYRELTRKSTPTTNPDTNPATASAPATGATTASAPATNPATMAATATATAPAETSIPDLRGYTKRLIAEAKAKAKAKKPTEGDPAASYQATAEAEGAAETLLAEGVARLDKILEARAAAFRRQVETVLGGKLLQDGEQVLAASTEQATIVSYPLKGRPAGSVVERTLDRLRKSEAGVVDLRILSPKEGELVLALSGCVGADEPKAAARLHEVLQSSATKELQTVMTTWPPPTPTTTTARAIRLDLRILEDPLDQHPSPITRAVHAIGSVVVDPPTAEQRLNALGRSLRKPGYMDHVGATVVPGDGSAVRLTAIVGTPAEKDKPKAPPEAVARRLASLLDETAAVPAGELYVLAVPAAKEQRMTVASPVLKSGFGKQQYDYLAGYIGILVMQVIGLVIVFIFMYMVRIGWVRRRGAEEAEATR